MKSSILICLFSLVFLTGLSPSEPPKWIALLNSLRTEKQRIERCLISVSKELQTTKQAYADLGKQHTMMQSEYADWKQALQERVKRLEEERTRLLADKALLAKRNAELGESESCLMSLKAVCSQTVKEAEVAIDERDTWRTIGLIGIPVAAIIGFFIGAFAF